MMACVHFAFQDVFFIGHFNFRSYFVQVIFCSGHLPLRSFLFFDFHSGRLQFMMSYAIVFLLSLQTTKSLGKNILVQNIFVLKTFLDQQLFVQKYFGLWVGWGGGSKMDLKLLS